MPDPAWIDREVFDEALEFIGDDQMVEVTPNFVRLRKRTLLMTDRTRESRKKARGEGWPLQTFARVVRANVTHRISGALYPRGCMQP